MKLYKENTLISIFLVTTLFASDLINVAYYFVGLLTLVLLYFILLEVDYLSISYKIRSIIREIFVVSGLGILLYLRLFVYPNEIISFFA